MLPNGLALSPEPVMRRDTTVTRLKAGQGRQQDWKSKDRVQVLDRQPVGINISATTVLQGWERLRWRGVHVRAQPISLLRASSCGDPCRPDLRGNTFILNPKTSVVTMSTSC